MVEDATLSHDTDKIDLFLEQRRRLQDVFRDFVTARNSWDDLIRRRAAVELEPEIAGYGDGIDLETPDLEEDRGQHIKILAIEPTKIDAIAMEESKEARRIVEDIRLWIASSWLKQNDERVLDLAISQQQVQYGVSVVRKLWEQAAEPSDDDIKEYTDRLKKTRSEEPADGWTVAAREEYFKDKEQQIFSSQWINPLECSWWPLDNPELFIWDTVIPYIEAKNLTNDIGEILTMDQLGKIAFTGQAILPTEHGGDEAQHDRKVRLTVRDAKDPVTGKWTITEYVHGQTGGTEKEPTFGDGELLREYDNPLGMCSFFVIPSGDEVITETDPHLRYRPMLYPLYVLYTEYNYLRTLIASLARKKVSDEDVYIDISKLTDETSKNLEEVGYLAEGAGAMRRLVFRRPEPGSGEIAALPHLERWPNEIEEHLLLTLQETKEGIVRHRPNRFLTGQAFEETKESTGTAYLDARQAAGLPYGSYLVRKDAFVKKQAQAEINAILRWDIDEDTEKHYYITTTGEEQLLKGDSLPGKHVNVTASKLRRRFLLRVLTRNETQAEKAQNDLLAYQDYNLGTITYAQLLRRLGHDDPERQAAELERDRLEKLYRQRYQQLEMQALETLFSAETGLNLTMMAGGPALGIPQGEQAAQGGQGPRGGGPNTEGDAPTENAPPPPSRPGITAAPIDGIQGDPGVG